MIPAGRLPFGLSLFVETERGNGPTNTEIQLPLSEGDKWMDDGVMESFGYLVAWLCQRSFFYVKYSLDPKTPDH